MLPQSLFRELRRLEGHEPVVLARHHRTVDHFPYDALIDVAEDGTIELNVQLKPIPD